MEAINVAKYILNMANNEGDLITNLRLQKLLYYAQAWYLVNFDRPLFDDTIKAWTFGPVVGSVYYIYKKFRHTPIDYKNKEDIGKLFSEQDKEFLAEFYGVYSNYSAHDLLNMSHNDAPWIEASATTSQVIDIDRMKEFYTKKYEELVGKEN